ncbi:MAG: Gfo/Idh/MocA family oxidoreductase [Acidimicrobiales bacterium]
MRVAVVGVGAAGARAARQLASTDEVTEVLVADTDAARAESVATSLGPMSSAVRVDAGEVLRRGCDAVVLAGPPGTHGASARHFLGGGLHVVSTSASIADVEALLELDHEAIERRRSVVAGAGFSPGLSCVLARHLAGLFDRPLEVHVARTGHGGPACARQAQAALAGRAVEWRDGAWLERRAGSGRELEWFPDPMGGLDCYRAAVADPVLLTRTVPGVERVTARISAGALDRVAARLRVRSGPRLRLRRPPADGGLGALRIEVRGRQAGASEVMVYGAIDRPAVAAGTCAAVACVWAVSGRLERFGAGGLGELADPVPVLVELARRGVKAAAFTGAGAAGAGAASRA